MQYNYKTLASALVLSAASLCSTGLIAARSKADVCPPQPGTPCYSTDESSFNYCFGPENIAGNPSVRPKTCNSDIIVTIAGLYWNSHQDGMEYAVTTNVAPPTSAVGVSPAPLNNLIDAQYMRPDSHWDLGFKLGLGYGSKLDGWDIGILWTHFKNHVSTEVEAESSDNTSLLPLWSAFSTNAGSDSAANILWANEIDTTWEVDLNLIDIDMGREFWTSKYLSIRPYVGIRIARIDQEFYIEQKGGAWLVINDANPASNGYVDMKNDFKGVGVRGGLASSWNMGRGFAFFGNAAISLIYGRFNIEQNEYNRLAVAPFSKQAIMETEEHFRSSKAMTDLELGLKWSTLFNDCKYGFMLAIAWEHHMFFDQNQLWRVNRVDGLGGGSSPDPLPNDTGENLFIQRRGDLSTQGWTLTAAFDF